MAQKIGLGKGFDSLIPTQVVEKKYDPTSEVDEKKILDLPLELVKANPDQPRKDFSEDGLKTLSNSIKAYGLLQPIVVTKTDENYMIIAGERRFRAFKSLKEKTIPAIVRTAKQQAQMELALIENLQREDLNILEVATALFKLADQFNLTEAEVGERVGRSVSSVHNILRLLGLPDSAKTALSEAKITEGHARQIMSLAGQPDKQEQLLEYMLKYDWNVRKAENFVKKFKEKTATAEQALKRVESTTPETDNLAKMLKTKVHLRHMAKNNQLVIEYSSDKQLEKILKKLN